jgi:hypothetical protein
MCTLLSARVWGRWPEKDVVEIAGPFPASFTLTTDSSIKPQDNTQLSGLYKSSGMYCTQCEAEGFRRITPMMDRPDVMAKYKVRIEAPKKECPVLLGNGNLVESGELENGRHFAVWEDPFPKPSYLFAVVAGDLGSIKDSFTTKSGRKVHLEIFSEHANVGQLDWAMQSLKDSMRWDEERFGLEYDLDVYNVVAVNDFNMGAMENKGLNVFNTAYILASPETATDTDYERVQGVIRARVLSQLDWEPRHVPRLVPAHAQGGSHGVPRPAVFCRHDFGGRQAGRRRAYSSRRAVPAGLWPDGAPNPPGVVCCHGQLLHRDSLQQGRRGAKPRLSVASEARDKCVCPSLQH